MRTPTNAIHRARQAGVTLVELMIVVGIIGLSAAFAVPGYAEYVRRAARADAQLVLLQAATYLERRYAECNSYTVRDASTNPPCTTEMGGLPSELRVSPAGSPRPRHAITLTEQTAQTWTLRARPSDASDRCGDLTLDSTGLRAVGGTLPVTECWRR